MEEVKLLIGDKGISIEEMRTVFSTSGSIACLNSKMWDIAMHLETTQDIITRERQTVHGSASPISPLETLGNIVYDWVQRVTSTKSYLTTFLDALEKSGCKDMADLLKKHCDQYPKSKSQIAVPKHNGNENLDAQSSGDSLKHHNGLRYTPVAREEVSTFSETSRKKCAPASPLLIWIALIQILSTTIIIGLLLLPFYKNMTQENTCPTNNDQSFWLNVTSHNDYLSRISQAPLDQRIKLGIKLDFAYHWPPQSNLRDPCNIVELHISGNFNYLILVSLVRQLLYITLVTIETNDCPDVSAADFVTHKLGLASDRLHNIQLICIKPYVDVQMDDKYQKLVITSYSDYKTQVSGLPPHVLLDVLLNISVPADWPNKKVENMLRVRKLTLMGPFLRESLISILFESKELEELHLIDSKQSICQHSAKWHSNKKPIDIYPKTDLTNLRILHFKNFADCTTIYEFFVTNTRSDKLHTFRLENSIVTDSNIESIQTFLKVNCQSLEILNLILKRWDAQFFNSLNTKFLKMTEIMIDFLTYEKIPKFLGGLLCDNYFPFLKTLILHSGYLPYDNINIILKCNKLQHLDFAVYIPNGMEPLRMNIFKSVMRLPPNFTLGLHFVDKSPSDICEVEFIEGIIIQPNCQLKDTN